MARIAKLLEEIEDLRGGKSIFVLNVVLRPNRSECFSWTTDTETTSIKELERAICDEYPDGEDGDAVLAIIHARGTSQHEGGGTERPSDDTRFRNIIKQYWKTNTKTLTVALETPTKKYTDFTLKEVNNLYDMSNMEAPEIKDLPPFNGISTEALDSESCTRSRCGDCLMRSIPGFGRSLQTPLPTKPHALPTYARSSRKPF